MIHIVPAVPPEPNGLADYCYQLWKNWPLPRPSWRCLAVHVPPQAHEVWPQATSTQFPTSKKGLLAALEAAQDPTVILHYVGYAYQPKGVPWWLPPALRQWQRQHPETARLIVMFHELYAEGGSWKQSSFWVRPFARRIMVELAQMSDHWVTSNEIYARKIETEARTLSEKGTLIPVGTSIQAVGNPTMKPWPLSRGGKLKIVIFGLPNTRLWALEAHQKLLHTLCSQDLVECITLLGRPISHAGTQSATAELQRRIGFAPLWQEVLNPSESEISHVVAEHDIGLLSNYRGVLTKSTVYAMFCEHRIVSVIAHKPGFDASAAADANFPCFVNDDTHPERCAALLQDTSQVTQVQQDVARAAQDSLSWNSITARWRDIVQQVEARGSVMLHS